jgi:CheY-like chemotaxis protein
MARRVLIVDDDPAIGQLLGYQLREAGFSPVYEPDPLVALRRLTHEPYDMLLLDAMMPQINGWELCARIRQRFDVPIIMVTGRDDDSDVISGLRAGADDYVVKPFSTPQLLARVEAVLRRPRPARQASDARPAPKPAEPAAVPVEAAKAVPSQAPEPRIPESRMRVHARQSAAPFVVSAAPALHGGALVTSTSPAAEIPAPRPAARTEATPPPSPRRLGAHLRAQRVARGLSLYQAERGCGVRWEFLQAIELDNYAFIPRADLRRALRAYSNFLNVSLAEWSNNTPRQRMPNFAATPTLVLLLAVVCVVLLSAYLL